MNNKKSLLVALALIGVNAPIYAMPPQPAKCPSVANIKSAGLSYSSLDTDGYVVAQFNKYSTNDTWLFGFASIQAKSSQEALSIGNQLLGTLFGSPKPTPIPSENLWACLYQTSQGSYGVALTPINMSVTMKQSIRAAVR